MRKQLWYSLAAQQSKTTTLHFWNLQTLDKVSDEAFREKLINSIGGHELVPLVPFRSAAAALVVCKGLKDVQKLL